MFINYWVAVFLLSLALYGLWCIIGDADDWFSFRPELKRTHSILVLIKNEESLVEEVLLDMAEWLVDATWVTDFIVADCGSEDLTNLIAERVARQNPLLLFVDASNWSNPAMALLPLCSGEVVVVLDAVNRLKLAEVVAVLRTMRTEEQ